MEVLDASIKILIAVIEHRRCHGYCQVAGIAAT
jgi:hypothetical protein